jgi:hypothetical protein
MGWMIWGMFQLLRTDTPNKEAQNGWKKLTALKEQSIGFRLEAAFSF